MPKCHFSLGYCYPNWGSCCISRTLKEPLASALAYHPHSNSLEKSLAFPLHNVDYFGSPRIRKGLRKTCQIFRIKTGSWMNCPYLLPPYFIFRKFHFSYLFVLVVWSWWQDWYFNTQTCKNILTKGQVISGGPDLQNSLNLLNHGWSVLPCLCWAVPTWYQKVGGSGDGQDRILGNLLVLFLGSRIWS